MSRRRLLFHHEPRTSMSLLIYKGCTLIKMELKQDGRGQGTTFERMT